MGSRRRQQNVLEQSLTKHVLREKNVMKTLSALHRTYNQLVGCVEGVQMGSRGRQQNVLEQSL